MNVALYFKFLPVDFVFEIFQNFLILEFFVALGISVINIFQLRFGFIDEFFNLFMVFDFMASMLSKNDTRCTYSFAVLQTNYLQRLLM